MNIQDGNESMIKSLYQKLMVSAIYVAQNNGTLSDVWQYMVNVTFGASVTFYSITILAILGDILDYSILSSICIDILPYGRYNWLLNSIILAIVISLINYFYLFRNNKYIEFQKRYPKSKVKLPYLIFYLGSVVFAITYVLLSVPFCGNC